MELTGKARIEFEKWYGEKHKKTFSVNYLKMIIKFFRYDYPHLQAFNCSPPEMKYGVYVDFFDSVGINIDTCPDWDIRKVGESTGRLSFESYVFGNPNEPAEMIISGTRPEARIAAITKANEIFNTNTVI